MELKILKKEKQKTLFFKTKYGLYHYNGRESTNHVSDGVILYTIAQLTLKSVVSHFLKKMLKDSINFP